MRSPIYEVKGRIVDINEYQVATIKAEIPDMDLLLKRQCTEVLVRFIDSRPLSEKQRKHCYALMKAIAKHTGMGSAPTKEYLKQKFVVDELNESEDMTFSLSNAPMSLVCAFQSFLVRFILDWDIPCDFPLLDFVDDTQDYLYACLSRKKCFVCGKRADLHHVEHVGMGRDREEIIHEGMETLPVCRYHHQIAHIIGERAFKEKFHIEKGIILDKYLCDLYNLNTNEEDTTSVE